MPPFDLARIILEWREWRWLKVVGPIVDRIEKTIAQRDTAKQRKRAYRHLNAKIKALRILQLKLERAL